jgi:hypothetical protein
MSASNLFLVSSAICTKFGASPEQRAEQTVQTIKSIRERVDADIWVLEASNYEVPKEYLDMLDAKVIPLWDYAPVQNALESGRNIGFVKSATESAIIRHVIQEPLPYERVYKISGRYTLNNHFNQDAHKAPGKCVFKRVMQTGFAEKECGTNGMLMATLWSFCPTIKDQVADVLKQIEDYMWEYYGNGKVADIEHGFWKFMPKDLFIQLDTTGVHGMIGHLNSYIQH